MRLDENSPAGAGGRRGAGRREAADVGLWDRLMREGRISQALPLTRGSEVSGTVAALGARHRGVRARRRQIRRDKRPVRRRLCRVRAGRGRQSASKPAALDYIRAAGLPVVAVTAWQMLFEHARIELGQAVLVRGAAGSVGACATQMAMEAGASLASLGPRAPGTSNACSAASAIRAVVDGERLGTITPDPPS